MVDLNDTDRWLCHYTSAEAAFTAILPDHRLRLSPYKRVRDPLENHDFLNITLAGFDEGGGQLERAFGGALEGLTRIRQNMRILCLTQGEPEWGSPFGCAWARARMWEHYADDHRGVCLVFDRDSLLTSVREALATLETPFYEGAVTYTAEGFAGSHARHVGADDFPDGKPFERAAAEYVEQHHHDFFLLKTADWATEFEYRFAVISPEASDEYLFIDYGESLVAVLVGHAFPEWQETSAREVCDQAGADFARLNWDMGRPFPVRG